MNRIIKASLALYFAAAALAACAGQPASSQTTALLVEAKEFKFVPSSLELVAGQPVKLTLQNTGTLVHDFSIMEMPMDGTAIAPAGTMAAHDMGDMASEPALHVSAASASSVTIQFTPKTPGTYMFFCSVSGHTEAGMTGTLTVKAP